MDRRLVGLKLSLLSLAVALSACAQKTVKSIAPDTQPCWIEQPVSESNTGQIGIARDLDYGGGKPLTLARRRAIEQLASHLEIEVDASTLEDDAKSFSVSGHTFHMTDDVAIEGYIYSYVTLKPEEAGLAQCTVRSCDINACDPLWLCSPSDVDDFASLGVSFQATSVVEKEAKAIDNGLLQAAFIYGSNVDADKRLYQKSIETYLYSSLVQNGQVDVLQQTRLPFLVTDRCSAHGNLYSRLKFPQLEPLNLDLERGDAAWMQNPKYQGRNAAVGSTERWTASGLFSDQIKLAIKRALIQLAFEQSSSVSEELYTVTYKSGNTMVVTDIREETSVTLSARVLSFRFKHEDGVLKVYAWVERLES